MLREPSRAPLPLPSPPALTPPKDFRSRAEALGVALTDVQVHQLGDYLARLLAMNEHLNLTAIVEPDEAWTRHALDALSLVPQLTEFEGGASVLDVGSGGGVPGIPIAIARHDLRVTLLDATAKKVAFIDAVARAIGLSNVSAITGRAETLARAQARAFDAVTARAVAKVSALVPWTAPFVRPGGSVLLIKGERAEAELADAASVLSRYRCTHERTVLSTTGRVVVLRVR